MEKRLINVVDSNRMDRLLEQIAKMHESGFITHNSAYDLSKEIDNYHDTMDCIEWKIQMYKDCLNTYNLLSFLQLDAIHDQLESSMALYFIISLDAILKSIIEKSLSALKMISNNPQWNLSLEDMKSIEEQMNFYEIQRDRLGNAIEGTQCLC